ncbi:MAG: hypothetical protein Kow00128_15760 [Deltaproteobacteria bacterium]
MYGRGIEKRDIFRDDEDRKEFHRRLRFNLKRAGAFCPAWAFLPNHFHFLFYSEGGVLSSFMHRLMSGYSIYFNKKHKRAGHLFQNRFRSSWIRSERYLLEAVRYIHLNPIRAGIVPTLEKLSEYPWTGHREVLASSSWVWADIPYLEGCFGGDSLEIRKSNYLRFLEMGLSADPGVSFSDGSPDEEDGECPPIPELPGCGEQKGQWQEFVHVATRICNHLAVPQANLWQRRRDRKSAAARRMILQKCCGDLGISMRDVCAWMGITRAGGAYLLRTSRRLEDRPERPPHEKL